MSRQRGYKVLLPGGPVRVRLVKRVGKRLMGRYHPSRREVTVLRGMHKRAIRLTVWHEVVEAILFDAGLHNLLSERQREALCDALALGLSYAARGRVRW